MLGCIQCRLYYISFKLLSLLNCVFFLITLCARNLRQTAETFDEQQYSHIKIEFSRYDYLL